MNLGVQARDAGDLRWKFRWSWSVENHYFSDRMDFRHYNASWKRKTFETRPDRLVFIKDEGRRIKERSCLKNGL